MARVFVSDSFETLDEERIALRIRIAILKERGGNYAELEEATDKLGRLESIIREMIRNSPAQA
jgi:hypothetical protein